MSLPVRTTPEADLKIREIDDWWRRNRDAARDLFFDFFDELRAAFEIIGHTPHIGRLYRQSPVLSTRRVLLKATRYHVYYIAGPDDVTVLAMWHGRRGVGPPLRAT